MRALARVLRHQPSIERMKRELDDRVALTTLERAIVALAHRLRERLDCRPQRCSTDRVQLAADENRPILPDAELKASLLNRNSLIMLQPFGIERVAQAHAIVPE